MDTRYWGPSGWRLLHLISLSKVDHKDICEFFNTLAYVLPCKYCRQSFSENIKAHPIEKGESTAKWLWNIHNMVNEKLRYQRLCKLSEDPSFESVKKIYEQRLKAGCTRTYFEGWEFLFSVAEAHPLSRQGRSSQPVQGHPAIETITDPLERNRWNVMTPDERLVYYNRFWDLIPKVLPFAEWSEGWTKVSTDSRKELLRDLWKIRCGLETKLDLLNRTSYNSLCKELQRYRSGCSNSVRGKTCRKKRSSV